MYAWFIIRIRVPAIIEIWERLSFYYHLNIYLCTLIAANSNDNKVLSFSNLNYKFKVTRITKNFWCTCAPPRGSKDVLQSVILPVSPFPIVHNNGRWCSVVIALLCSPSVCFPWPSFNNTITNHNCEEFDSANITHLHWWNFSPDTRHQTPDTRHQTPDTRHRHRDYDYESKLKIKSKTYIIILDFRL